MDEFQIEVLKANGYDFKYGGIIDSQGKYVSSVELNGKSFNSSVDLGTYTKMNNTQIKLTQPKNPIQKIKDYEKNPTKTVLTPQDKMYYPVYEKETKMEYNLPELYKFSFVLIASLILFLLIKKLKK